MKNFERRLNNLEKSLRPDENEFSHLTDEELEKAIEENALDLGYKRIHNYKPGQMELPAWGWNHDLNSLTGAEFDKRFHELMIEDGYVRIGE